MGNKRPMGKKIIDALERLGFEVSAEDESFSTLVKGDMKVSVPFNGIPDTDEKELAARLKSIFDEYRNVPLHRKIERIKDWAEEKCQ
ncbi:hypothetical protein GF359_00915 [candidate division WOR-3 bacterium]|uniref:Uncharacterized protein n=1 Tax=candidate division WOR-3 bacterium TaxID=2052148 RepID=A0A9D5K8W7_UNCW3|nr:hypothetical protein [candidate division WOR-3 bacterium]MBD3363754.1 hypothetical protein [candidate division WOR-3 bacterium]